MRTKQSNPMPIRFPDEITARVKEYAASKGIPKNRLVVNAVIKFLEDEAKAIPAKKRRAR
jgi:predicted transcriptional regulator